MKQHKISIIAASITTVLSLVGFTCGYYYGNEVLRDICAAIFSSSFFVIALSAIGYYIEKNKLQNMILSHDFLCGFELVISAFNGNNGTTPLGMSVILIDVMKRTVSVKKLLEDYYTGAFVKDKSIKAFINEKLIPFGNKLKKLEEYNIEENRDYKVFFEAFSASIAEHAKLVHEISILFSGSTSKKNRKKKTNNSSMGNSKTN